MSGSLDGLKSHIRTYWPLLIGAITSVGTTALAEHLGVTIDSHAAYLIVGVVTTALVYSAGRWLETRSWRPARIVGGFIVGLGLVPPPTYPTPEDPAAAMLRQTISKSGR